MDLESELRVHDLRVTTPRRLVWQVLSESADHLTAQSIFEKVNAVDAAVNRSSVYRTLSLFAEIGLARESKLGEDEASRWEPAHADDEIHLVCESCDSVLHHSGDVVRSLRSHLGDHHDFEARAVEIVVRGRCATCGPAPASESTSEPSPAS